MLPLLHMQKNETDYHSNQSRQIPQREVGRRNAGPQPQGSFSDRAQDTKAVCSGDLAAVTETITVGGKTYRLKFCNRTFRLIEDVYRQQYHRVAGLAQVLDELEHISISAVMAVFYAAMLAADNETVPTWEEYDEQFSLADVGNIRQVLAGMIDRAIPATDPDPKNA
ncbi:MAG: hypothetical protein PHY64_00955 [Eubacteriales bacterium]|nr:hypothetical protein [Eubacteriales bacterium]